MNYVPVKDKDEIEFLWVVEDTLKYYQNNPINYISSLLGHEGKNSLFSLLKDEGLALELSTSEWPMLNRFSFFFCNIQLTKKGLNEIERVINFVASYLKMLTEKGIQ